MRVCIERLRKRFVEDDKELEHEDFDGEICDCKTAMSVYGSLQVEVSISK